MRQTHPAGERVFVDFAGQTLAVIDPATGEIRAAQVFVAVLGASSLTYAEVRWGQGLADWVGCHVNAFAFFGGAARQIVCDNLKAGVTATCRYEPGINRTYGEMAAHYGTAVVPTRVRKPRDKAKVEVGVQVVERWILACLRNQRPFGLEEANSAVRELLQRLNARPMRRLGTSRRELFERLERGALLELPPEPFEYAEWRRCRVGLDYHVEVLVHWYSVPYRLARTMVKARITERTPAPCRLDLRPAAAHGGRDRPRHSRHGQGSPAGQALPRAGLPERQRRAGYQPVEKTIGQLNWSGSMLRATAAV